MYKSRSNKFNRMFGLPHGVRRHVFFNADPGAGGEGGGGGSTPSAPAADATPPADPAATPPSAGAESGNTPPSSPEWMKDWSPELKDNPLFKDIKDPQDIAKALIETQGKVIARPAEDATPEQKQAFDAQIRELMGVPKDAKDYGLTKPEGLTPEMEALYNEEGLAAFGQTAVTLGLTKEQVAGLQKFDQERTAAQLQSADAAAKQREQAFLADFTKVHGTNADKVLDTAGAIMESAGKQADIDIIKAAPEAVRKAMANILHGVAQKYIGEGQLPGQGGGGNGATKSLGELETDLKAVIAKPEYRDQFSPNHQATLDQATQLSQQIALLKK